MQVFYIFFSNPCTNKIKSCIMQITLEGGDFMSEDRRNEDKDFEEEEKKKELEIVAGDGKDLDISPVYDHIKMDKSNNNTDKKQKIIIPKKKEE